MEAPVHRVLPRHPTAGVSGAGTKLGNSTCGVAMAHEQASTCLRCGGPTEPGMLVDHGYGIIYPLAWVAGAPRWSRWFGLRLAGRPKLPVVTYRCTRCGRTESFVKDESWPAS
jgi:ribosomal protein L37E